jgi:hypothetical protein
VSLANSSSPEEDDIQGFSVQAALRLSKAGILAEVNELKVVHAQLVDAPGRASLTDAVILAVHTEVLEALLQCWVRFKACAKEATTEYMGHAAACLKCSLLGQPGCCASGRAHTELVEAFL